jgi:excisionase family DNA binding protein
MSKLKTGPNKTQHEANEIRKLAQRLGRLPSSSRGALHDYIDAVSNRKPREVVILADLHSPHAPRAFTVRAKSADSVGSVHERSQSNSPLTFAIRSTRGSADILYVDLEEPGSAVSMPIADLAEFLSSETRSVGELDPALDDIRNYILRHSYSTQEAATRLGVTPQAVRKKAESKKLLGIKMGRDYRFPDWQFSSKTASGIIGRLEKVLAKNILDPLELGSWFVRKSDALEGMTPFEALDAGNVDDVVAAAEAAGVT